MITAEKFSSQKKSYCERIFFTNKAVRWMLRHLRNINIHLKFLNFGRKTFWWYFFLWLFVFCFGHIGETFAMALNISKAFNKVWHKALSYNLTDYSPNSSLRDLFSDFISDFSIRSCCKRRPSFFKSFNFSMFFAIHNFFPTFP